MAAAGIAHLLRPKVRMARRRAQSDGGRTRMQVLAGLGVVFWFLLFGMMYRLLSYFRSTAGIGDLLAVKLLGLILLAFLSVLMLSNIITALTSFFLARDLELLQAAPLRSARLYGARLLESMSQSSWMVVLVLVPVLTAYGIAYHAGPLYIVVSLFVLFSYLLLPAVSGTALTLVLVNVFPARRTRDLLALVALFGAAGLVMLLRLMRPEQLSRPEAFRDLVDFVAVLNTPSSVWLPSDWAAEAMMAALAVPHLNGDLFPLLLIGSTAAAFVVFGLALHERLYANGYSRAQEGAELRESAGKRRLALEQSLRALPLNTRSLVAKDVRTFFRDTTQWSQLILLAVLLVIYVYNIKVLPLWTGEKVSFFLVNVISFLNLGLGGFVLAAIAARFIFPAISLEGRTLWLLRSSPLDLRKLIWCKYAVGITPLLVVAVALTAGTNTILRVGPFMMTLSLITIVVLTFGIASLALGFGAMFPRFETDNAAEISTGYGGLMFMMSSIVYLAVVISLEAWPVYSVLSLKAKGQPLGAAQISGLAVGLGLALVLSLLVIFLPLRIARQRIEE